MWFFTTYPQSKILMQNNCPNCLQDEIKIFYEAEAIPVHSVLLHHSSRDAREIKRGDIRLAYCNHCGFVTNQAFDADLQDYSAEYESTQSHSATFSAFAERLAKSLIKRFDLHHKTIIEIGCGQGEFLSLLCQLGDNRGIGFDPAYRAERSPAAAEEQIEFISDYYSERYKNIQTDFVVCKMTLEHIHETARFVQTIRQALQDQKETVVYIQVPDATRVFAEQAFWDIYYEHCSYFTPDSLRYVFENNGFSVLDLWRDYNGQYLMLVARPNGVPKAPDTSIKEAPVSSLIDVFSANIEPVQKQWMNWFRDNAGRKIILWGGGSKAVAFVTTLRIEEYIDYVVDINPLKNNTYLAGTTLRVVSPDFIEQDSPEVVILMNAIYTSEVAKQLKDMGLQPEIMPLE